MKRLFLRFLLFTAIVAAIYWGYLLFMSRVLNEDRLYRVNSKKTVLIMGDSHTAYGIIDSSLDNVINLSQPADVYLYNYLKLKKTLPLNPQIHTVIMGCGGHNIQQFMSKVFLKRHGFTKAKVQNYYHLLSTAEMTYLLAQSPDQVIKGVIGLPKLKTPYIMKILRGQYVSLDDIKIGGYAFHDDTLDLKKNFADVARLERNKVDQVSKWAWQIGYLHQMVDLCKSRNVKVIFVRMPEHKLFPKPIEPVFQQFLHDEFGDIPFVDYLKMELPDSCYADLDHLNYYGAKKFTDSFRRYTDGLR